MGSASNSISIDQSQRFLFEDTDIRGERVLLEQSYQEAVDNHNYPAPFRALLGEFLAAACLLSSTIKFKGKLSLQAQSPSDVALVLAECTSERTIRGIVRLEEDADPNRDYSHWLAQGQLAINIEPEKGERYQGLVSLDGNSLGECLENYFRQSEQLETRIWLAADQQRVCGVLLQVLPSSEAKDEEEFAEEWNHVVQLAKTLKTDEMLNLDTESLLFRLYHQESVRLFEEQPIGFACSCSRERTAQALVALGRDEARKILDQKGSITVQCHFCSRTYRFSTDETEELFPPEGKPLH